MNIMVFDVPAENGGALSILKCVYDEAVAHHDKSIKWIFVLSKPYLTETSEVKILRYPWIKKSWCHRYFFDYVIARKLAKKFEVELILSLQNIIIPGVNIKQILYVHQSLPFVERKYTFFENKTFWIYQNIIGKKIIQSIKKADQVIVQTIWMKKVCIEKAKVDNLKIRVVPPKFNFVITNSSKLSLDRKTFFYPASAMEYKNHNVIVEASERLQQENIFNYAVILTVKGDENDYIKKLNKKVNEKGLPIKFIGHIPQADVFQLYSNSILLFPSLIETFGLPLQEGRMHKCIILASNKPFSKEVLENYSNSYFFDPLNGSELFYLMKSVINEDIKMNEVEDQMILKNNSFLSNII